MIHGQKEQGVAVILEGFRTPEHHEWESIEAQCDGIEHRILMAADKSFRRGWKCLQVSASTTPEQAEIVAKKHSQHCRDLLVIREAGQSVLAHVQPPIACAWAPVRGPAYPTPWEGQYDPKPWEYACEVTMAVMDTPDTLPYVVELLRLQSVRPFIVIVDTGSTPENWAKIEALRAPDVEVHSLRFNGARHPSDFPAIACDIAMAACRAEKLVFTHADVFVRSRTALEELLAKCSADNPAVGYQMTEREHPGWEQTVSHTWTALHMPTMDRIGAGWSLRRFCTRRGAVHAPNSILKNLPDTESLLSDLLIENGIAPEFIGTEVNFEQTVDSRIRHVRSLTGARLYAEPGYKAKAEGWLAEAIEEAKQNIRDWQP